jgi:hypothetical protein
VGFKSGGVAACVMDLIEGEMLNFTATGSLYLRIEAPLTFRELRARQVQPVHVDQVLQYGVGLGSNHASASRPSFRRAVRCQRPRR